MKQEILLTYKVTPGDAPQDFVERTLNGLGAKRQNGTGLYSMTLKQAESARGIFVNSDYNTSVDHVRACE